LARVTKAPASFDPQKLVAFQSRWMHRLPLEQKVAMCWPYLASAGWVDDAQDMSKSPQVTRVQQVIAAADDRIKLAGDILEFDDFFVADSDLQYDTAAFDKRLKQDSVAVELLRQLRKQLSELDEFTATSTEACLKQFVESQGIKFNQIIHALRVSVTGKAVGFGMFDTLAILGQSSSLARIDRALSLV
ncbi:MAG: glutamate--tRNA ligase, partial [Planctomycetales bacterium]|nr:glutamate--tRNA ligase [Planctomycetales bacterium]